jgi:hypothetical protein
MPHSHKAQHTWSHTNSQNGTGIKNSGGNELI